MSAKVRAEHQPTQLASFHCVLFFFAFNQFGLYFYWAKENNTMVTSDNASTQQPNFKVQTEEIPKSFKKEMWLQEAWVRFHLVYLCFYKDTENHNKRGWGREQRCSSLEMGE